MVEQRSKINAVEPENYLKTTLILGIAGSLFSGYLSAVKLFTAGCALNETCPDFLGYPACYFGFGLFFLIFLVALFGYLKQITAWTTAKAHLAVSLVGVAFAAYFAIPETQDLLAGNARYSLGLSSCAYGLIFFIAVLALASSFLLKKKNA